MGLQSTLKSSVSHPKWITTHQINSFSSILVTYPGFLHKEKGRQNYLLKVLNSLTDHSLGKSEGIFPRYATREPHGFTFPNNKHVHNEDVKTSLLSLSEPVLHHP